MTIEICLTCDKEFEINDGFDNKRMITCVKCLKKHFELTELIIKKLKKIEKRIK